MYFLGIWVFILSTFKISMQTSNYYQNYDWHDCARNCDLNDDFKECVYNFNVEWFMVLSRDCLNCTENARDCERENCISADGESRPVRVANRMLPGPSIQVCKKDLVIVNVHNNLNNFESTTIHWHGLKQFGTPEMDGVGMLTQCPITPRTSFQYKFKARDRGTHFWHAHSSSQRADGLFGAFIVREKHDINAEFYDFDLPEHVVVVNDWVKPIYFAKYIAFAHDAGNEAIDSILINGRGVSVGDNKATINMPRSLFSVEKGYKYRFRVINAGILFCPLEFSVQDHELTVIAVDGNPVEPVRVASFIMSSAERVDFVLNANRASKKYWIKVRGLGDCESGQKFQTAVLKYKESTGSKPQGVITYQNSGPDVTGLTLNPLNLKLTNENKQKFMQIDQLRSVAEEYRKLNLMKITGQIDKQFYINLDMNLVKNTDIYTDFTFRNAVKNGVGIWRTPQFNNITFKFANTPLFYQNTKIPKKMFCNSETIPTECIYDKTAFCRCIHILEVELDDVVEILLVDGGSQQENHPIHLHGNSFAILKMEKVGSTLAVEDVKRMDERGEIKRNLINPPFKDTITVPSAGYVVLRFFATNPGYWFMHCHIDFHSESGMALVVKIGKDSDLPPKPINWPQCGDFKETF